MKNAVFALATLLLVVGAATAAVKRPAHFQADEEFADMALRLREHLTSASQGLVEPSTPWLKTCAGWTAMEMCSTVFGSGLPEETAWNEDVGFIPRAVVDVTVDHNDKSVTVSCLYLNPLNETYKAIWRHGIGCTLVERVTEAELRAIDLGDHTFEPLSPDRPWPMGEGFFPELIPEGDVDYDCLDAVAANDFPNRLTNVRAYAVVYNGQLVYEQYADGITKDTPLLGWSATKSFTHALIGTVVQDGLLNIYDRADVPEWYEDPADPRQNITYDMMMRMTAGTRWTGDLPPSTGCLFWSDADCAHVCALQPLDDTPDTLWNYNSGSTYVLSRISLTKRGDPQWNNYEYPKRKLFWPIGAHSAYIEYQANHIFLGGGSGYATARDWARFGLLYLNNGVWIDGTRILPDWWSAYASAEQPVYSGYGAGFWRMADIDTQAYYASGFRNQNVYIFPRQKLVIARLAMPPLAAHPLYDQYNFITSILQCFPNAPKADKL